LHTFQARSAHFTLSYGYRNPGDYREVTDAGPVIVTAAR